MKRLLLSFIAVLLLATPAKSELAAGSYFQTDAIWIGVYTVATLPTPSAAQAGVIAQINDASAVGDCATGGGSDWAMCRWNGTSWDGIDGSSGGANPTGSDPLIEFNDTDAAGADDADEEAAQLNANLETTTEDAEDADFWITAMQGGTRIEILRFDESDDRWETVKAFYFSSTVDIVGALTLSQDMVLADGAQIYVGTTTNGHEASFRTYDDNGTTYRDALSFIHGDSSSSDYNDWPQVKLGDNVALTGVDVISAGFRGGGDISTNTTLTAYDVNATYRVKATCEIDFPQVASGVGYEKWLRFEVYGAYTPTFDPYGTEIIRRQGTAQTGGIDFDTDGTNGAIVFCLSTTDADGSGGDGWSCTANVTLAAGS